jgi:hypothetical protein
VLRHGAPMFSDHAAIFRTVHHEEANAAGRATVDSRCHSV